MSAVTQSRMDGREVVRCECGLIQFKAASGLCVKSICRKPYVDPENDDSPINPPKTTLQDGRTAKVSDADVAQHGAIVVENLSFPVRNCMAVRAIPAVLRAVREAQGISQERLAKKMGVARTFVSKIELSKAAPILRSFERMCTALGISMKAALYLSEQAY